MRPHNADVGEQMAITKVTATFNPGQLKAYSKNEAMLNLKFENLDNEHTYWCECDIKVNPPLSLEHDRELFLGRTRVGLLGPNGSKEKQVRIYTRPNNFPDDYTLSITTYAYDDDGAIAERAETMGSVPCVDVKSVSVGK